MYRITLFRSPVAVHIPIYYYTGWNCCRCTGYLVSGHQYSISCKYSVIVYYHKVIGYWQAEVPEINSLQQYPLLLRSFNVKIFRTVIFNLQKRRKLSIIDPNDVGYVIIILQTMISSISGALLKKKSTR